jgi:hypothetical protein
MSPDDQKETMPLSEETLKKYGVSTVEEFRAVWLAKRAAARKERKAKRAQERAERLAEQAARGEIADATQAETMVRFLASRFDIRMPKLQFNGRGSGSYDPASETIYLSKPAEKSTIAHEFAHHLDDVRNNRTGTVLWKAYREAHSRSFYFNLRQVVEALGMDYLWHQEYKQVWRWARRDGLLKAEEEATSSE